VSELRAARLRRGANQSNKNSRDFRPDSFSNGLEAYPGASSTRAPQPNMNDLSTRDIAAARPSHPSQTPLLPAKHHPSQDQDIQRVFLDKANLQKFKDMVVLQMRKKDLRNQVLVDHRTQMESERTVLPLQSFKQVLQTLGIQMGDKQLKYFHVKGDFLASDQKS